MGALAWIGIAAAAVLVLVGFASWLVRSHRPEPTQTGAGLLNMGRR